MNINIKYLKDENNNVISPVTSVDSIFTSGGGNLIDFIYPIGSLYMSTDGDFNPNIKFGGTWEQIKDTFIYASGDKHKSSKMTVQVTGEDPEYLWVSETGGSEDAIIPYHKHTFTGSSHSHTYSKASSTTEGHSLTPNEMPRHGHGYMDVIPQSTTETGESTKAGLIDSVGFQGRVMVSSTTHYRATDYTGGDQSHSHNITLTDTTISATAGGTISYAGTSGNTTGANMPPYMTAFIWKRTA